MRSDAASLLVRLKQTGLRYREFTDPLADTELWPIFEALLTDERMVGKPRAPIPTRQADDQLSPLTRPGQSHSAAPRARVHAEPNISERTDAPKAVAAVPLTRTDDGSDHFVANDESMPAIASRSQGDLRAFFSRLSVQHDGHRR